MHNEVYSGCKKVIVVHYGDMVNHCHVMTKAVFPPRVFDKLIWRTIGPKSFLFGTAQFSLWASGAINYDYIVTNSINSLLIGSRCIPNGAHANHF